MDLKERSPSFLGVKINKTSSEKNSPSKAQKMKFKPMPSMQLLQSLKMYSPGEQQASSTKKLNIKAARTNELNLDEFKKSPKVTTRNVRKQLWSVEKGDSKWTVEKGDKLRRVTVMKPGRESLRKSVFNRPSMVQPKKNTTKKSTCLSIDDTLPLMDMEQFTVTKIKRTLFSAQQAKPLNQRKTTSHINVNKLPTVSTFAKKIVKPPMPTIVITPVEKNAKKSLNKSTSGNKQKIESEKKSDTMSLMVEKLSNIEDKIGSFDDIKALLCTICVHLGIEVPDSIFGKPGEICKQSNKNCSSAKEKRASQSPCYKKDLSSTPLPTINENVVNNTEFKETVYKLSPFVIQPTSNVSNEINENSTELKFSPCALKVSSQENIELKTSPCIEKVTMNSQLDNITKNTTEVPINNIENTETELIENCEEHKNNDDDNNKETPLNLKDTSQPTPTNKPINPEENLENSLKPLNPEDIITPKSDHKINNKVESTIKLKKTWITQFEQLENKLLNNSNESVNIHSSPDNSPVLPLQIDKIVNDDEDSEKSALVVKKSPSTSNLLGGNTSLRKNIFFKSKETDLLTESICGYNELRGELPKFLSTPVNNTNKTMSFMTPSVQGNEKKLISRRVQEQLLRLNDY